MFVLYNLAHKETTIKSPDGEAWVRIIGFFPTKLSALHYAKKFKGQEVRISPTNEFRMLMLKTPSESTMLEEMRKHSSLLHVHDKLRSQAFEETARNAAERKMGALVYNVRDTAQLLKEEYGLFEQKTYLILENDLEHELKMQKFCAISIIPDYERVAETEKLLREWEEKSEAEFIRVRNDLIKTALPTYEAKLLDKDLWKSVGLEEPTKSKNMQAFIESNPFPEVLKNAEPAIKFLFAGETEEEVQKWILENSKLANNKNYDIACVAMYALLRVADFWDERVKRSYREPELAKLHENKLLNKLEAEQLSGKVKEIVVGGGERYNWYDLDT